MRFIYLSISILAVVTFFMNSERWSDNSNDEPKTVTLTLSQDDTLFGEKVLISTQH